jgi:3',5'-cyclic-AMP phosphodiesterase
VSRYVPNALDAHPEKPASIVAHHNHRLGGDPLHFPGGLIDSQELGKILASRRHVKAYVTGAKADRQLMKHVLRDQIDRSLL